MINKIKELLNTDDMDVHLEKNNLFICSQNLEVSNLKNFIGIAVLEENDLDWKYLERRFVQIFKEHSHDPEITYDLYLVFFLDEELYRKNIDKVIEIEKNKYFCKKYVFSYNTEKDFLISKLPFVNTLKFKKRKTVLAISKLLEEVGIDKDLISEIEKENINQRKLCYLIKHFFRCKIIKGNLDYNKILLDGITTDLVHIKKMELENFRVYNKNYKFDLNKDLIVIYGSNSFGKTALFDAFEYAITGEVKRIGKNKKALENCHDSTGKKFVKVEFLNDKLESFDIERHLNDNAFNLFTKNEVSKKLNIKTFYNNIVNKNTGVNSDNMSGLFMSTHLLNQNDLFIEDNQEATTYLSSEALSKLVLFNDYKIVKENLESLLKVNKDIMDNFIGKLEKISFHDDVSEVYLKEKLDEKKRIQENLQYWLLEDEKISERKRQLENKDIKNYIDISNQYKKLYQNDKNKKTTIGYQKFLIENILSKYKESNEVEKKIIKTSSISFKSHVYNKKNDVQSKKEDMLSIHSLLSYLNFVNELNDRDLISSEDFLTDKEVELAQLSSRTRNYIESCEEKLEKINQDINSLEAQLTENVKLFIQKNRLELALKNRRIISSKMEYILEKIRDAETHIFDDYCKSIEPVINTILWRLRPIYGFSDIKLTIDKKHNRIKIKNFFSGDNTATELNPFFYLSEAQKNILRLSIFLSTALTQNWSSLKTIFMDDPIQHLDDLNAYSFINIIKDLIISPKEEERKQIIISTCNLDFYRLIRKKFEPLEKENRVGYYTFDGLDSKGPIVRELE